MELKNDFILLLLVWYNLRLGIGVVEYSPFLSGDRRQLDDTFLRRKRRHWPSDSAGSDRPTRNSWHQSDVAGPLRNEYSDHYCSFDEQSWPTLVHLQYDPS